MNFVTVGALGACFFRAMIEAGFPGADNADGTITDNNTGLMWEKKIKLDGTRDAADLNDADNCYPWTGRCQKSGALCEKDGDCVASGVANGPCEAIDCQADSSNGKTLFQWVAALNLENRGAGFAGHDDWRVPNVRELQSIVDYGTSKPALSTAFNGASCGPSCTDVTNPACSCTQSTSYWSSTTYQFSPAVAWLVHFGDGSVYNFDKANFYYLRAVRGGL